MAPVRPLATGNSRPEPAMRRERRRATPRGMLTRQMTRARGWARMRTATAATTAATTTAMTATATTRRRLRRLRARCTQPSGARPRGRGKLHGDHSDDLSFFFHRARAAYVEATLQYQKDPYRLCVNVSTSRTISSRSGSPLFARSSSLWSLKCRTRAILSWSRVRISPSSGSSSSP